MGARCLILSMLGAFELVVIVDQLKVLNLAIDVVLLAKEHEILLVKVNLQSVEHLSELVEFALARVLSVVGGEATLQVGIRLFHFGVDIDH